MIRTSFIIPVYNRDNHIKNTLEALNQLIVNDERDMYEVIVIDDGSDKPIYNSIKGINRNYELKYVYLERNADSCLSRARNTGWRMAQGKLIVFIDSDIIVKEDYLKEVYRYYNYSENILLLGTRLMLQNDVQVESILNKSLFTTKLFTGNNYHVFENRYLLFNKYSYNASCLKYPWLKVYGCNLIVPKDFLQKIGGFDENFKGWGLEDVEFGYRCYKNGLKILVNSRIEVFHQYHGDGTDYIKENQLPLYRKNIDYFINKYPEVLHESREFIFDVFEGKKDAEFNLVNKSSEVKIINFKHEEQIHSIKEIILKYANESGNEIIINDCVENTDIDVWIQLLGVKNSTPKYFITSRKDFSVN